MTAFWVGDIPAEDLVVDPARGGVAVDLAPFTTVSVSLRDPEGALVDSSGFLVEIVGEEIVVEWPDDTVLELPGAYELTLVLEGTDVRETLSPLQIIVQVDDGWHSLDSIRWDDAPDDDETLYELLVIAKDAVQQYAPALAEDARPPANYRKAQRMQAENVWNSSRVNPVTGGEGDGFVLRPFPLDWQIKQILRPKTAIPWVG